MAKHGESMTLNNEINLVKCRTVQCISLPLENLPLKSLLVIIFSVDTAWTVKKYDSNHSTCLAIHAFLVTNDFSANLVM